MNITGSTIKMFKSRVSDLCRIRDITKLPQWTDADVVGAECLLSEYLHLSASNKALNVRKADLPVCDDMSCPATTDEDCRKCNDC